MYSLIARIVCHFRGCVFPEYPMYLVETRRDPWGSWALCKKLCDRCQAPQFVVGVDPASEEPTNV